MFSRIYNFRALLPILCGLVLLALSNNAIVWTLCPDLNAGSRHCVTEDLSNASADSATMRHERHDGMAMDEEAMPLESTTGENIATDRKPSKDQLFIAITQSQTSCSHCIMHSPSPINSPSTPLVLNNSGPHAMVAAASINLLAWAALSPVFLDVNDHGPPGLRSSRYILNRTLRI